MQHGIVYRAENEIFKYIGWPTVCRDENNVLYAVCSGHRISHICPYGKNYLFKSFDGGNNWTNPIIINDTALDDRDAGIVNLGGGKMLMTYFNHPKKFYIDNALEHSKHVANREYVELHKELYMGAIEYLKKIPDTSDTYGSFVKLSEDYGNTWGKAIKVPVSAPHGPILLKNGKLLYVGKEFHSGCEIGKGDILSYESSDEGKTWKLLSTVKDTKGLPSYIYTEPHSIELANGRILCGIRVQDGDRITIHLCHSDDGGKTWTEPKPLGNSGSPPHFMLHSTGAVILSYGRREVPYGQRALISYDNGETFTKEITLRDDSMHSDLGYPSSVELDDGSIVTVYYQDGVNGDHYRSLIYTKWNLDEV